jgi:hypothetical protein
VVGHGASPFTVRAYVAVGAPVILLVAAESVRPTIGGASVPHGFSQHQPLRLGRAFPWLVLILSAATLEAVGLALGGRSGDVPTLSTVIDHALARHLVRFVLFCGWLGAGWAPFLRALRKGGGGT